MCGGPLAWAGHFQVGLGHLNLGGRLPHLQRAELHLQVTDPRETSATNRMLRLSSCVFARVAVHYFHEEDILSVFHAFLVILSMSAEPE